MSDPGPTDRLVALAAWIVVAIAGVVMLTQAVGYDGIRAVATAQTLTPYLLVGIVPAAALGLVRRRHVLAAVAASVGVAVLLLAVPIVVPPSQAAADPAASAVRIGSVNLLYSNERTAEVADDLAGRSLDVIVFSEFTAEHQLVLDRHDLADDFPHRIERDGLFAGGVAVWSRFPLEEVDPPDTVNYSIDARVGAPDGAFRLLAVHPPTPVYDFDGWRRDLELIGDVAAADAVPTAVVGDFNASYWHPRFRELLGRGLTDAHMALGRGWSTSWPTDEFVPPFVRLDHALTGWGLVSTGVEDFRVPGSDHAGLVVSVAPARRAAT